jgi:tripartite ATP-independent transporter DctP family solute receptor
MKKLCGLIALLFVGILTLPLFGHADRTGKLVLKAGHGLTQTSAMHRGWLKFKEVVEKNSNGEIRCEVYPNQKAGGDLEMIEAAKSGKLSLVSPSSAPLATLVNDFFILDAPFSFTDRTEAFTVLDGPLGRALYEKLDGSGLVGLAYWENGFRNLSNSRNPVRLPGDVAGMKLRTMENDVQQNIWKTLGAEPVPMSFGGLFTALQQKTVDGQENPFAQIFDNKFFEVQPYITKTQHVYTPFTVLMNRQAWDELSDAHRNVIVEAMEEATRYQRHLAAHLDEEAAGKLEAAGRSIVKLAPEELAAFREAAAPVFEDIKSRVSPEVFQLYETWVLAARRPG